MGGGVDPFNVLCGYASAGNWKHMRDTSSAICEWVSVTV